VPKSKGTLILILINTLAILGALGMLLYTKVLFERPKITEVQEREKLAKEELEPKVPAEPGWIDIRKMTLNIRSTPEKPKPSTSPLQIQGKLHYVTLSFSIEISDINELPRFESVRPVFMDKIIHLLGTKTAQELSSAQGRFLLRTRFIEIINELVEKEHFAKNVFFNEMIVQ
tara:strand:- start:2016 stop:2534 length:519 start_codon:yes stop_codon:yes gene_type:complete